MQPLHSITMNTKVLICEDDEELGFLTSKVLERQDYSVDILSRMAGFMEKVKLLEPDIILMDIRMPEIGGVEAINQLRKDKATAHIPVVIVSGDPDIKQYASNLNLLYIRKPFDVDKLESIVRLYGVQ